MQDYLMIGVVLKPQGIRTLVTGPLEVEGKYVGFFGVDNPPVGYLSEVSELLRLISYARSRSGRRSHPSRARPSPPGSSGRMW